MLFQEIISRAGPLPASGVAEEVNRQLQQHNTLVITAPPGAGKSTLLPLTIWRGLSQEGKVVLLEPRRLAARQIAERMASILDEKVGETVGYRVRFEKQVSPATRIEVLTEGILTRMLVDDATLDGVDVVVFDEFHERSIHSDVALALVRQLQQVLRPELKIVIMSATIDASTIGQTIGAPIVECQGKMFPVDVYHTQQEVDVFDVAQRVAEAVLKAYRAHEGDILAFLPGQGEIGRCAALLEEVLPRNEIHPLYGNLSSEKQRAAIAPSPMGSRKVVLATPIAETSLTIEGVRVVVDGGFCRTPIVDQRTGLTHLETVRISKDRATQRMGRAGRVAEGVCYRLWTVATEQRMAEHRQPELLDADLASMVLDIAAYGESDVMNLPWLTLPPKGHVARAVQLLKLLGALDKEGAITHEGRRMASLACHPRIARMILSAANQKQTALACDIAAVLEEKDPLSEEENGGSLPLRIDLMREARRRGVPGRWARQLRIAQDYAQMAKVVLDADRVDSHEVGALLSRAYPERVAMAFDEIGTYRLASGDLVRLASSDALSVYPMLTIASLFATGGGIGRVLLAAPVEEGDVLDLATESENLSWDSKQSCVVMRKERRIGKLLICSMPVANASQESLVEIVCEAVAKEGRGLLDWNDEVAGLQRRVAQVALWHPEMELPDLSTDELLKSPKDWLSFYLSYQGRVRTSAGELKKIDLKEVLWAMLSFTQQQEVDRLAPSHLQVPTGSRIRLDYRLGSPAPVLSVRLQECFGMQDTPCVDGGRCKVLMELLSPGFKPVQLTQDLRSFWQNTYFEVRKELKRRYPKHHWPDNPLEALPVRGAKKNTQK